MSDIDDTILFQHPSAPARIKKRSTGLDICRNSVDVVCLQVATYICPKLWQHCLPLLQRMCIVLVCSRISLFTKTASAVVCAVVVGCVSVVAFCVNPSLINIVAVSRYLKVETQYTGREGDGCRV